jgi:hypothetical protein
LGASKNENLLGTNGIAKQVGNGLPKIQTPTIGSVFQRLVVILVDERLLVASFQTPVNQFIGGEWLGKGIRETVHETTSSGLCDLLVFLGPWCGSIAGSACI